MNATSNIWAEIMNNIGSTFESVWYFLYDWGLPLLSAVVGSVLTLAIREYIDWLKRPRLQIDFEKRDDIKHYVTDENDFINAALGDSSNTYRLKSLRLKVSNKGRKAALNCETKLEITEAGNRPIYSDSKILHWARRHELLHTSGLQKGTSNQDYEKMYAPVDINRDDFEYLEVLKLRYITTIHDGESNVFQHGLSSASVEAIGLVFGPNIEYTIKVTVNSYNAKPAMFSFKIKWDGTIDGFNQDVVAS